MSVLRILFWIVAVIVPAFMLYGASDIKMGNWEFISARIIVYLFLITFLGYLTWKNRKLEKRIEQLEQNIVQK